MNYSALNRTVSAQDAFTNLNRPQALKMQKPAAVKSIDEEPETPPVKSDIVILADSRSASHEQVQRLNETRRHIITESYSKFKNGGVTHSLMVFIRMFAENPQYKNIWPQFRQITDSSLISSDQLRNHARVYFGGMNQIIEMMNAGNETEFRNCIRRMARSHAKFVVHKNHVMDMLPEFLHVISACGTEVTEPVRDAWFTLFDVIGNLLSKPKS
uniref:GLOBIN domain-containing protein n=1 Tax=Panagrellus redivivus TaxID=6233 RepID=A0A7E4UP62_PANRE